MGLLRANELQREALAKRVIPRPAPMLVVLPPPEPTPAATPEPSLTARRRKWLAWKANLAEREAQRRAIRRRERATRKLLAKRFPQCFAGFGKPKRPFKIGIFADIIERAPDIDRHDLTNAVDDYCGGGCSYLAACVEGAERVDLDGNVTGIITKGEAHHSAWKLARLKRRLEGGGYVIRA